MKKLDLGQTITVLANIGVIAGIVFLAVELRQNQTAIEEQTTVNRLTGRDAAGEAFNGFRRMLLENPYLIPVWEQGIADAQLSPEEFSQFRYLCQYRIWMQVNLITRVEALGLAGEFDGAIADLADEIRESSSMRQCWNGARGAVAGRGYGRITEKINDAIN